MANQNLQSAKAAKNDEFYTQYQAIEKEITAYIEYNPSIFRGKIILLPCDDPEWSNFTKFFAQNFQKFGLKKLISTSYAADSKKCKSTYKPTKFEQLSMNFDKNKTTKKGKIFTLTKDNTGDGRVDVNDLDWEYMAGDGDFRSAEVKKLREEADIIITNPPFSLFGEFLAWIMEKNKEFVIIGKLSAITSKEVFPLIGSNKMWFGKGFNAGNAYFSTPFVKDYAEGVYNSETGLVKFRNCCWLTNLDHGRRHQAMPLMTMSDNLKYSKHREIKGKEAYDQYDNYNAIEVPFTDAIPSDYDGVMGVPVSFLDKYNPDQFEILGSDYNIKEGFLPKLINPNWKGKIDRGYLNNKRLFTRIFIKHRK